MKKTTNVRFLLVVGEQVEEGVLSNPVSTTRKSNTCKSTLAGI